MAVSGLPDNLVEPGDEALTRPRQPLPALTGIRFVAAYYVVLFHTRLPTLLTAAHQDALANLCRNGFLAVPLFFILSGLILAYTYAGQIEQPGDARRFWEARIARIWPVYLLSLLFSALPHGAPLSTGAVLAAVFMVQAWNPLKPELGGVLNLMCWTLSVEAFFYLVFPFLQVRIEKLSRQWLVRLFLAVVALGLISQTCLKNPYSAETGVSALIPLPIFHLLDFLAGVITGNYLLLRRARAAQGLGGLFTTGSGLLTYSAAGASLALLCSPEPNHFISLVLITFAALLLGLAEERTLLSRLLSTRAMLLGGAISYSVYLMQLPVKNWVLAFQDRLPVHSQLGRMGVTATTLLLVAWLCFVLVEDPARRLIRRFFGHLERRRTLVASVAGSQPTL